MKKRFIRVSNVGVVDRRKVVSCFLDMQTMKTFVIALGGPPLQSDFTLTETAEMMETGEQLENPKP